MKWERKPRPRRTEPGDIVRSMAALAVALDAPGGVLYLRGKHQPKAVLRSMTFHTLSLFVRAGVLRRANYTRKESA